MSKRKSNPIFWSVGILVAVFVSVVNATNQPVFNIIPTTPTAFLLPSNSSEIVQYQVTNATQQTRTLTMQSIAGVVQTTEGCTNPFVLAPQQSCLLTLQINGGQMPARITGGPVICQTKGPGNNEPNPNLCARPSIVNTLSVSQIGPVPSQQIYITNWVDNSISLCNVSDLDGSLFNCAITATTSFANPEALALNPSGTLLYVANINASNMATATVSVCSINSSNGSLSNCIDSNASPVNGADGISINNTNTLAYVSNAGNDTVSVCAIDASSGLLSNSCTETGSGFFTPSDMTLNALGTRAYVSNLITSSVSSCEILSTGLLNCDDITFGFNAPEGITLHPSGQFAYVANNGNNTVSVCQVNALTGHLGSCSVTGATFDGFGNVAFNAMGSRIYIPRLLLNSVMVCSVNQNTGALSRCRDSGGSGFVGPSGILLK